MATRRPSSTEAAPRRRVSPAAVAEAAPPPALYFATGSDKENHKFVSSGCQVMDEALGGGYVLGRCVNIVGDRSSGKTLKAMEVIAQFVRSYPDGWVRYAESEAAFDVEYAAALGIPVESIIFNDDPDLRNIKVRKKKAKAGAKKEEDEVIDDDEDEVGGAERKPMDTVEAWYDDLEYHLNKNKTRPGLYILDSLDALSDASEQDREFGQATYGGDKPKRISELFRRKVDQMEAQSVLLIVVSQIRDKIDAVAFGETKTRSGGKALDFYCTHIVWLAEVEKLYREISKIKRCVGIKVEAYVKKNKIGLPFRRARYPILFGYGIDDITANIEWLIACGREKHLADLDMSKAGWKVRVMSLRDKGGDEVRQLRTKLNGIVHREWGKIETTFLPKSSKY